MIISINSVRKAGGCTTLALALGITLSHCSSYSVLLVDANYIYSDIDAILGIEIDTGLDDVLDLINSNRMDREIFKSLTVDLGNLHILAGSKVLHYDRFKEEPESFNRFIKIAEALYDIIIIDSPAGSVRSPVYEWGGLNICVLKQNFLMLESYVKSRLYNCENSIVVINQYEENNKLDKNKIIKQCRIEAPVFTLCRSDRLFDAFNEKKVDELILNYQDDYIDDLRNIVMYISQSSSILLKKSYLDAVHNGKSGGDKKQLLEERRQRWFNTARGC